MKILKLELKNIGPYRKETINFESNRNKNVILLCGDNGAGKTTILKSIKLGLFGSYLYGLKQNSKSAVYIDEVKSLIRNKTSDAYIVIKFSIVENYVETVYEIIRAWSVGGNFKETVEVYENRKRLEGEHLIKVTDYINHYFTPNILDTIMFDGEKIISLIENNTFSEYIEDSIIHLFGLNYYEDLIKDIKEYINTELKETNMTLEQIQLKNAEACATTNKKQLLQLNSSLKSLSKMRDQKQFRIDELLIDYSNLGGVSQRRLSSIKSNLSKLEKNREDNRFLMKSFLEDQLLFMLNEEELNDTSKRIKKEEPRRYVDLLSEMIESKNVFSNEEVEQLNNMRNHLLPLSNEPSIIGFSKEEAEEFLKYGNQVEYSKKAYNDLMNADNADVELIKKLRETISITETDEMEKMFSTITNEMNEMRQIEQRIQETAIAIANKTNDIAQDAIEIESLKKLVFNQTKDNNAFVIAKKYLSICEEFYNSEIKRITKLVGQESTKLIKRTYRKKNYITKVEITEDFNVKIFNKDEEKNIFQLSAGEKQLFVGAVFASIIKASGRNFMLVFDTPAGRLDNEHMVNFYTNIMINTAKQVIIMPTSKEINEQVIEAIKERVSACYTLNYKDAGYSVIEEGQVFDKGWD